MPNATPGEGDAAAAPGPDESTQPGPDGAKTPQPAVAPSPAAQAPTSGPGQTQPAAAPRPRKRPGIIVRYGAMKQIGEFRHNLDAPPKPGTRAVIRTERGVELGEVVKSVSEGQRCGCIAMDRLEAILDANGAEYPFRRDGKVLRLANPQDIIDQRHLDSSAREEGAFCRQQIGELDLNMKLVTVEHLLGGERIIFHFTAESRVDFRELVRRLASQFRTRIEMRQVGARDEARLVADYERCGQRCCCQQFLKNLRPISMRMAKMQKATLDPAKISGRCSRLMCCLRYEDATYEVLRKALPRKNTWVRAASVIGRVTNTQILTQLVELTLADGSALVVANEEIVERDVPAPKVDAEAPPVVAGTSAAKDKKARPKKTALVKKAPEPEAEAPAEEPSKPVEQVGAERTAEQAEAAPAEGEAPAEAPAETPPAPAEGAPAEQQQQKGQRDRRRRRRGRRRPGRAPAEQQKSPPQATSDGSAPSGAKRRRPRRRRKRRKPPSSGQSP